MKLAAFPDADDAQTSPFSKTRLTHQLSGKGRVVDRQLRNLHAPE
jgi:hypothetical protein